MSENYLLGKVRKISSVCLSVEFVHSMVSVKIHIGPSFALSCMNSARYKYGGCKLQKLRTDCTASNPGVGLHSLK